MLLEKNKNSFFVLHDNNEDDIKKDNLPSGIYEVALKNHGMWSELYFKTLATSKDKLVKIEDGVFKEVYEHIINFFSKENAEIHKNFQMKYKAASILYGPPGTGKTCLISMILKDLVKSIGAICIYSDVDSMLKMATFTRTSVDVPLVFVLEEVDNHINHRDYTTALTREGLLNFLDGFTSTENIYVLATTNYIDRIGTNFINRPSRFERKFLLDRVPKSVLFELVKEMVPTVYHKKVNIEKLAYELSEQDIKIDELKHVLVNHVKGTPLKQCLKLFTKLEPELEEGDY